MRLGDLLPLLDSDRSDLAHLDIRSVTEDSRRAAPGCLFFALRGEHVDGHDFVERAVAQGAVAVAGDRPDVAACGSLPYIRCTNPRRALGLVAHRLAGNPSRALTVIGVTGTNGKSSVVSLLQRMFAEAGHPTACFGTLGYVMGDECIPAPHTTPFAEDLARIFAAARDKGMTHVAMEVSSHALIQERVAGIRFDAAAFTNLTQDHLDYHRDLEDYLEAKLLLFKRLERSGAFAVINLDDPAAPRFLSATNAARRTYGTGGDYRASDIRIEANRMRFRAETPAGDVDIETRLLGRFNVSNILCAMATGGGLGLGLDTMRRALAGMPCVPGRFEHVDVGQPFQVIVDYAHTEDGLRNVLQAARDLCRGRLLVVFGCGGDRDRGKRPKMGAAAATLGDFSILTSDNPRSEDPLRILEDIEAGMIAAGRTRDADYLLEPDRAAAIERAIRMASPGDVVMIAGKGHEDYQILGPTRIHFDDRETAREILRRLA